MHPGRAWLLLLCRFGAEAATWLRLLAGHRALEVSGLLRAACWHSLRSAPSPRRCWNSHLRGSAISPGLSCTRSWPICAGSSLCLAAARDPYEALVLAPSRRTR